MGRALIVVRTRSDRDKAALWVAKAPVGTRITFAASKRTIPQSDFMWSMLTDIAQNVEWHGLKLRPEKWKLIFLDALKAELQMVPNLNGDGFVNLGRSSSDLSKEEMSDLIELIRSFGANHNVTFIDQRGTVCEKNS